MSPMSGTVMKVDAMAIKHHWENRLWNLVKLADVYAISSIRAHVFIRTQKLMASLSNKSARRVVK